MNNFSKETLTLVDAFRRSGLSQAAAAAAVGVSPANFRQWLQGMRPVPPDKAPKLAQMLDVSPEAISEKYARVAQNDFGNVVPLRRGDEQDVRRTDLAINRVENDVDALRYALAGLVSVMVIHRPAEAADAATAIRRSVPKKFLERGFVYELLQVLDATGKA